MTSTPPQRGLIDTQLLIEIRSGQQQAHLFAQALLLAAPLNISEFSAMILLSQTRTASEFQRHLRFLNNSQVYSVTSLISQRAYRIMSRQAPPSPLTAADAVIAATALTHKL